MAKTEDIEIEKPVKNKKPADIISIVKYFELVPGVDKYTVAYLSSQYHGILKTKEDWTATLSGKGDK